MSDKCQTFFGGNLKNSPYLCGKNKGYEEIYFLDVGCLLSEYVGSGFREECHTQ